MSDNDAIERLSKRLDSKTEDLQMRRSPVFSTGIKAPQAWKSDPPRQGPRRRRFSALELLFAGSLTFFVVALAISSLLFFSGNNTISTKNVDIHVSGPSEIGAGNTLSLQVVITNRNAVPMELTDLIVEFPPGTRSDTNVAVDLPRIRESLGTIQPGDSVNRTIRSIIFGVQDANLTVKASVEYRVPSSNAVFVGETDFVTKINQAPVSIVIDALKESVSGQDAAFTVTVSSNSSQVLTDMLLLAEYPPGFTFISSDPPPVSGTAAWNLGDIEEGGKRVVAINGRFTGEDGDTRVMHFSTGNKKGNEDDQITAPLSVSDMTLVVTKPFVSVALDLDGASGSEFATSRGKQITGTVHWTNNLPVRVQDIDIQVSLKGTILDKSSVSAQKGFYRSSDNTITWSKETEPSLADVDAGVSGSENFVFSTFPPSVGSYKNPELEVDVTVRARRISETNVPETVTSSASTRVVVATDMKLIASLTHGGIFSDTGPFPPRVDKETSYTATWQVTNSANALANVTVTAMLPSYVKWTGRIQPGTESIAFNPVGNIITWPIGDLAAGASKTVSFQVAFTPSLSQTNDSPTLVGDQRIYGLDRFIRASVEHSVPSLSTRSAENIQGQGTVLP
jgi:hypothetical protein